MNCFFFGGSDKLKIMGGLFSLKKIMFSGIKALGDLMKAC